MSEKYHVDVLLSSCEKIPYFEATEGAPELKELCLAKAIEISSEKKVNADRYAELNG